MSAKFKVSVIIPTKNRYQALKDCLDSLCGQTYRDFEVVVVDGDSSDGTKALVDGYIGKLNILFSAQEGGLIRQENKGWSIASGDILVRTDDDVVASPDWIYQIVNTFDSAGNIGGVTGPTVMPEEKKDCRDLFYFQKKFNKGGFLWMLIGKVYFNYFLEGEPFAVSRWFRSGAFSVGSNFKECLNIPGLIEVTNLEACNMAMRRGLLAQIGGFDESFAGIGEYNEADVAFKIRKLGYKIIFNPKAIVHHLPSTEGFFKDRPNSYSRILNFINFYFRHIKPNNLDKSLRFFSYILFLNCFFIYKAVTARQINQLGCIPGTIMGLTINLFKTLISER